MMPRCCQASKLATAAALPPPPPRLHAAALLAATPLLPLPLLSCRHCHGRHPAASLPAATELPPPPPPPLPHYRRRPCAANTAAALPAVAALLSFKRFNQLLW
jgi:hypothetical protein